MNDSVTMPAPQRLGAKEWLSRQWQMLSARVQGQWRPHRLFLFDRDAGLQDTDKVVAAFGQWCEAHPGAVCSIGLSGRWVLASVCRVDSDRDVALTHAVRQWAHYLDLDESTLSADWVWRQLDLPQVSLLCAVPNALIVGLHEQAQLHAVKLEGVHPWWVAQAQAWMASLPGKEEACPAQAEYVLCEPGLLTRVRAQCVESVGMVLGEVWSEVSEQVSPGLSAEQGVCMPAPQAEDLKDLPYERHLWSHAGVAEVMA